MSRDPFNTFDDRNAARTNQTTSFDDVKEQISQAAAKTKDKAGRMAETVSETLAEQRENAAEGLGRVASVLHDKANSVPGGPKLVNITHSIANGMESTATYLREHDLSKMSADLMKVCRKYPTQSVVAALALGFLVGRSARR